MQYYNESCGFGESELEKAVRDYIGEAGIGKTVAVEPDDPRVQMGPYGLMSHGSGFWRLANDAKYYGIPVIVLIRERFEDDGVENILKYGIACYKKRCKVMLAENR